MDLDALICRSPGVMAHPGLPAGWVAFVLAAMTGLCAWSLWRPCPGAPRARWLALAALPVVGPRLRAAVTRPAPLVALRVLVAAVFLYAVYAGLFGTPIPERNLATTLTWTFWWTGIIVAVYFVGSAWCAVCPWDALASWLVRRRLWRRGSEAASLNLRVPQSLRSTWPALGMFVVLTWLELGVGVTTSPYATAILGLVMVVLATTSLAVFERKAFCRYFCSVGRTLGFYAQLSPLALRPVDPEVCARCRTLDCYHGNEDVEPCPTHLVMGRMRHNTYCTSCGACSLSCPHRNVGWRLRPTGDEAVREARPKWDEAWFVLGLVALTSFHGITMLPFWEPWMRGLARAIHDSGRLLWSFSLSMVLMLALPVALFALAVELTRRSAPHRPGYRRLFAALALPPLPLAFAYHLAHNINHLAREGNGLGQVLLNPLGVGAQPLTESEMHLRHLQPLVHQDVLFAAQAGLLLFGFWMAVRILRHRMSRISGPGYAAAVRTMLPMLAFIALVSLFNLWLLMQPMIMRM